VDVLRTRLPPRLRPHYEAATATYEQALRHAEEQDAPLEIASAQRDLGILYSRQEQLEEAIQAWSTALKIYEAQYALR
jgi:tetratricopeptide (TPR) repeat protein